jgi:hypothetical protein
VLLFLFLLLANYHLLFIMLRVLPLPVSCIGAAAGLGFVLTVVEMITLRLWPQIMIGRRAEAVVQAGTLLLVIVSFLWFYIPALRARTFVVVRSSRHLAKLIPPESVLVGEGVATLGMETPCYVGRTVVTVARELYPWERDVQCFEATHLVCSQKVYRHLPGALKERLRYVATLPMKRGLVRLYEIHPQGEGEGIR